MCDTQPSSLCLINFYKRPFMFLTMFRCLCGNFHKFFCFAIGIVSKRNACIMMQSNLQIFWEFLHSVVPCISGCHLSKPDVLYITMSCINVYLKLN